MQSGLGVQARVEEAEPEPEEQPGVEEQAEVEAGVEVEGCPQQVQAHGWTIASVAQKYVPMS